VASFLLVELGFVDQCSTVKRNCQKHFATHIQQFSLPDKLLFIILSKIGFDKLLANALGQQICQVLSIKVLVVNDNLIRLANVSKMLHALGYSGKLH